jgi:hypothetical protein
MANVVTIRQRPDDIDFMTPLREAAERNDRPIGHYARQVLVYGLLQLGEIRLPPPPKAS